MSHSHGLALYALTRQGAIGVDIERCSSEVEIEEIAAQFFSPRENSVLRSQRNEGKRDAFFTCWTRKEAYLKARGVGLMLAPTSFTVSILPGEPAALLDSQDASHPPGRWVFYELPTEPNYKTALVVEGPTCRLRCWDYEAESYPS
jgi:4'-phosphopantetheinyl transferase